MTVVLLGLGAAIIYGGSDFFGAFAARRIHLVTATLFNYAVATVGILVALLIVGGEWSGTAVLTGVLCGVLAVFGLLTFYGVLAIGPMSLLSPLIALIQSVVPVVAAIITGQPLTPLGWIAVAIGVVALLLLARRRAEGERHITVRGAVLALVSGVLLGGSIIALDFAPHDSGVVPSVLEIVVGLAVLGIVWLVVRVLPRGSLSFLQPPTDADVDADASSGAGPGLSARRAWVAAAASGILTAAADAFIVLDLHVGNLAVVSVLVGLYPVPTVILAATVLRERMTALQFVAVGLVIVASLLFSAASA